MHHQATTTLARLRWPLYLAAIGLIVIPLLDFVTSVLPLEPYDIKWRFGSVALLSGFLFTPLLAIMLIMAVAAMADDRVMQRAASILNLLLVLALVVLLGLFALDALQLRNLVPDGERLAFDMSAVRAAVKYGFMVVTLLLLGIAGFRASREPRATRARRESVPLVSASQA